MPSDTPQQIDQEIQEEKSTGTYEAGCHYGYIKFSVTLTPALSQTKPVSRWLGSEIKPPFYHPDPEASSVTWHNDRFNTKENNQMFCKHCGASIGIDFREAYALKHIYGISVRSFYDNDLDSLTYRKLDGRNKVPPGRDTPGQYWGEEEHALK